MTEQEAAPELVGVYEVVRVVDGDTKFGTLQDEIMQLVSSKSGYAKRYNH